MADEILPFIVEKDYQAFCRNIKRDFPDAYDEWPAEYDEWLKDNEQEAKKLRLLSQTVGHIEISPDVFAKFCRDNTHTNHKGPLHNMWLCARDRSGLG